MVAFAGFLPLLGKDLFLGFSPGSSETLGEASPPLLLGVALGVGATLAFALVAAAFPLGAAFAAGLTQSLRESQGTNVMFLFGS